MSKKIGDEIYSGSFANKGEMTAVVIGTGNNTFIGGTASLVASAGGATSHSVKATTQIGDVGKRSEAQVTDPKGKALSF